ncbi:hypothetical protein IWX90DRAFT_477830 [Phyllosticta citrichinensis]|uniref:F-box domain-containing protein n=1 Tax=Phyllosticta citrichinensis TaxID=1130410 RepID=A0ABR1XT56_9PEZI
MVFRTLFYLSVLAVVVPTYSLLRTPYVIFDLIRRASIVILEGTEEKWDRPADALWVREGETPKEIVDKRNLSQSQLYRLPTELLCLIDDHLDPAGVRAIRATNSTLRDRLGMAKVEGQAEFTEAEPAKAQMSRWMIRQLYPRLCERERRVGAKANSHCPRSRLYLCQPCAERHPIESFSPEQIRAGPETRRCLPQERVFRMCEHMTVDFSTMKDPIKRHEDTVPGRLACVDCPKRLGASTSRNWGMDQTILYEKSSGDKWYFRTRAMYPLKTGQRQDSYLSACRDTRSRFRVVSLSERVTQPQINRGRSGSSRAKNSLSSLYERSRSDLDCCLKAREKMVSGKKSGASVQCRHNTVDVVGSERLATFMSPSVLIGDREGTVGILLPEE